MTQRVHPPRIAGSASPGNLLEMEVHGAHPRLTELTSLGWGKGGLCYHTLGTLFMGASVRIFGPDVGSILFTILFRVPTTLLENAVWTNNH